MTTKQNKIKEQMEKLLLELVEKRGKHSKLWMYPKSESLKEAVDQLYSLYQEELKKHNHDNCGHTLEKYLYVSTLKKGKEV